MFRTMTSLYEPNFLDPGPKVTQVVPAKRGRVRRHSYKQFTNPFKGFPNYCF